MNSEEYYHMERVDNEVLEEALRDGLKEIV